VIYPILLLNYYKHISRNFLIDYLFLFLPTVLLINPRSFSHLDNMQEISLFIMRSLFIMKCVLMLICLLRFDNLSSSMNFRQLWLSSCTIVGVFKLTNSSMSALGISLLARLHKVIDMYSASGIHIWSIRLRIAVFHSTNSPLLQTQRKYIRCSICDPAYILSNWRPRIRWVKHLYWHY